MNTFSISESIRFGWRTFNERRAFFIGAAAVICGLSMLLDWLSRTLEKQDVAVLTILSFVISVATSTLIGMGEINFALKAVEAPHAVKLKDLWAPRPFWIFLGTAVLSGIIVLAGFILLVIPAFIFGIMIMFAGYVAMDERRNPIASIKESARLTKGNRWKLFGFTLAMIGVNLLGLLALVVGLLVSIPVTLIATAKVYRTLQQHQMPVVV